MPLTRGFNFDSYLFNTIGKTRATNFGYGQYRGQNALLL